MSEKCADVGKLRLARCSPRYDFQLRVDQKQSTNSISDGGVLVRDLLIRAPAELLTLYCRHYTGDDTWNEITTQALLFQVGPAKNFEPVNQTRTEVHASGFSRVEGC